MDTSINLESLTLRGSTVFLNFWKKAGNFADLLRSSKLVDLGAKILTFFIQNLVQNLMNLVLSSKNDRKWPKNSYN